MHAPNYHYLSHLIGPLNTVTDEEASCVTSNEDEDAIRQIIRLLIRPDFESLADESQKACKNSLRYFLTTGSAPFCKILDEQQEWPIEPPKDPKLFFIWIWEELFPGEDYRIDNLESWKECNDISKVNMCRR